MAANLNISTAFFGLLLFASACTDSRADVFNAAPESVVEAPLIEGARSQLPGCGDDLGDCGNAVAMICDADEPAWNVCVTSPNGDVERVITRSVMTASISPSGKYILSASPDNGDSSLVFEIAAGSDGATREVPRWSKWFGRDDLLVVRDDNKFSIQTIDGEIVETIPLPDQRTAPSIHQLSNDGRKILAALTPAGEDRLVDAELWVWSRDTSEWKLVYDGEDFINAGTRSGFSEGGEHVIVQVTDIGSYSEESGAFSYSLLKIGLDDGKTEIIFRSSGSPQLASVSPDGKTVASQARFILFLIDVESGNTSNVVRARGNSNSLGPVWSSDSTLIASGDHFLHSVTAGDNPKLGLPVDIRIDKTKASLSANFRGPLRRTE